MGLGTFGVWTAYGAIGEENAGEAASLVAELGFGTFWLGGSPRLSSVRPLLEADETLTVATGIVNVWAYEPAELAREYAELSPQFGDRLLVGIGIGHPEATSDYARPLASMRAFLDGIDAAPGGRIESRPIAARSLPSAPRCSTSAASARGARSPTSCRPRTRARRGPGSAASR